MSTKLEFVWPCQIDKALEVFKSELTYRGSRSDPKCIHFFTLQGTQTEVRLQYTPKARYKPTGQLRITLIFNQDLRSLRERNEIYFSVETIALILAKL